MPVNGKSPSMSKKNRSLLAGSLMPPSFLGNDGGEYTMGCMSPVTRLSLAVGELLAIQDGETTSRCRHDN
ncbi:hypothetical protein AERO9A_230097 [Aeromonas salmonicida]|nr:hypothetical protein AERO9A_230097 [Aeromonas salmonicida]